MLQKALSDFPRKMALFPFWTLVKEASWFWGPQVVGIPAISTVGRWGCTQPEESVNIFCQNRTYWSVLSEFAGHEDDTYLQVTERNDKEDEYQSMLKPQWCSEWGIGGRAASYPCLKKGSAWIITTEKPGLGLYSEFPSTRRFGAESIFWFQLLVNNLTVSWPAWFHYSL